MRSYESDPLTVKSTPDESQPLTGSSKVSPRTYSKKISYGTSRTGKFKPSPKRHRGRHIGKHSKAESSSGMVDGASESKVAAKQGDSPGGEVEAGENRNGGEGVDGVGGGDSGDGCAGHVRPSRRGCVVFIVFLALLLDSLLLTCMAPILPNFLRESSNELGSNGTSFKGNDTNLTTRELNATDNSENTRISFLFASKTMAQVLANLFVGPLTARIGYTVPMFMGFVVLLFSILAFAFANTYYVLLAARAFQGVGTALSTTSGMGLIASIYPDQNERASAQTKAFSGLMLGVFLGPPYGGVLYDFTGGKEIPLLILAAFTVFEGVLQLMVMRPKIKKSTSSGPSILTLLTDPYILITAGAITISNLTTAVLEPALPVWLYYTMGAPTWLQGMAFVPSTLAYLLFLQVFGACASRMLGFQVSQRWICTILGMSILAVAISWVPYNHSFYMLIVPLVLMGIGEAIVCTCLLPHVGTLVDQRHEPVYGTAYAITDNAFCMAFAVGPAISGPLIDAFGFTWTLRGVSVVIALFIPLVLFLRNPPQRMVERDSEKTMLVTSKSSEENETYSTVTTITTVITSEQ